MGQGRTGAVMWFSGFFGLGAVVHFVRFVLQVPLRVGAFEVPLGTSAVVAVVLGVLSAGLFYCAVKPSCCSKQEKK